MVAIAATAASAAVAATTVAATAAMNQLELKSKQVHQQWHSISSAMALNINSNHKQPASTASAKQPGTLSK